jgi:hypothetical protein
MGHLVNQILFVFYVYYREAVDKSEFVHLKIAAMALILIALLHSVSC